MACAVAAAAVGAAPAHGGQGRSDWPVASGDAAATRYSPLREIHRGNVATLERRWTYRHGDVEEPGFLPGSAYRGTAFQATPILVDELLIFPTPFNRVIALDAESGEEHWTFDPGLPVDRLYPNRMVSRGVAWWRDPEADGRCTSRIFLATLDARLIALDARDGAPCRDFGEDGTVDLLEGVEGVEDPWEYNMTSPPQVVGDRVVVGSSMADTLRRALPSGVVRAFDARTGEKLWSFHPVPPPGEEGSETWSEESLHWVGGANAWSLLSADLERGVVYLPLTTAGPDFYGGDRPGANLFSGAVVAVDAETGRRLWHFQTIHHGIWDYDLPTPPILVSVPRDGRRVEALAQVTKTGFVFVLDRATGEPLFPVEEHPVPQSTVPGERTWPTQPVPTRPPPLTRQRLSEDDLRDDDPELRRRCVEALRALRNEGLFTPPSLEGTLQVPGTLGGANWSGGAWDPERGWLFVPTNDLPFTIRLEALPESNLEDRNGRPLRSWMDGLWFWLTGRGTGFRYRPIRGRFQVDGQYCHRPPWGQLSAVDLATGEIRWQVPAGEDDGVRGLVNLGPILATGGGLVFHAGASDLVLRAHDAETGQVLARFPVPAGLHAGAMTYKLGPDRPQMLVIAPGGHVNLGTRLGDWIIAYSLPE